MQHFNLKLQQRQQQFFPFSYALYQIVCVFNAQTSSFLTLHLCKDQTFLFHVLQHGSAVHCWVPSEWENNSLCLQGDFPITRGTALLDRHVGYTRTGKSWGFSEQAVYQLVCIIEGIFKIWLRKADQRKQSTSLEGPAALRTCRQNSFPAIGSVALHLASIAGRSLELVHFHPEPPEIKINA